MEAVNDDTSTIGYEWSDPDDISDDETLSTEDNHVTRAPTPLSVTSSDESNSTITGEESEECNEVTSSNDDPAPLDTEGNNHCDKTSYFIKNGVCDKEKGSRVTVSRKMSSHEQEVVDLQSIVSKETFFVRKKKNDCEQVEKNEEIEDHWIISVSETQKLTEELNKEEQPTNYENIGSENKGTIHDKIAQRSPGFPEETNTLEGDKDFVTEERQRREGKLSMLNH